MSRKMVAEQRVERIATGGGSPKKSKEDPLIQRVASILRVSAKGLPNVFDSHVLPADNIQDVDTPDQSVPDTEIEEEIFATDTQDNINPPNTRQEVNLPDWGSYTPAMLRTPVSRALSSEVSSRRVSIEHSSMSRSLENCDSDVNTSATAASTSNTAATSRKRRPAFVQEMNAFEKSKIEILSKHYKLAKEEQARQNEIHVIRIKIEREKLRQEQMKSKSLEIEIQKKL